MSISNKFILLFLVGIFSSFNIFAESSGITFYGRAIDGDKKQPLIGASVLITSTSKAEQKFYDVTGKNGKFELKEVIPGEYNLKITYIGYNKLEKKIKLNKNANTNLGDIALIPSDVVTEEIEVTAQAPMGEQKEDTTIFNSNAFKTTPDATAEDLIKKMPGVQVESSGTVKAQGEEIKKVLVDGKPFFGGDDPSLALKNLPAEVIDKVQIFDKMSDQAQFTGFDDGNSVKTMNIITKRSIRNGNFGKFTGGASTQDKYTASLTLNHFEGTQRISLLGLSNNINQQNFNMSDIMGMLGNSDPMREARGNMMQKSGMSPGQRRSGSSGPGAGGGPPGMSNASNYLVGMMDGVSTTHAIGLNFSDVWNDNFELTGSYFFNYTDNDNDQTVGREYLTEANLNQYYDQTTGKNTKNTNHKVNFEMKYQIDSSNSFIMKPSLTFQGNKYDYLNYSETSYKKQYLLNSTDYNSTTDYDGISFSNDLLYRLKFNTPGRTLSLNVTTSLNDKDGYSDLFSVSNSYTDSVITSTDTTNQKTKTPTNGYGLSASVNYTEPLSSKSQLQFNYNANYNKNKADKRTYDFSDSDGDYTSMDTLLSNKFESDYITQRAGLGYMLNGENFQLTTQLNYQRADLKSSQVFPLATDVNYTFDNFLPSARFNYKFSKKTNLRLNYRTSTNSPSISQLQNVIDNSNPLQLSSGNPELKQQYSHNLHARYSSMGSSFANMFMTMFMFNYSTDYIATSYIIPEKDTIIDNVALAAGGQYSKPVNLDGYYSLNTFFNYGFQFDLIKSNVNMMVGGSYSRTPGIINNVKNFSNAYNAHVMCVLSSNISENLDFTLASRVTFNTTKNSMNSSLNNNYNIYNNNLNLNWIFFEGFFIQSDIRNQFYTGLAQSGNDFTLVNLSIGKKLFAKNAGEIKLTVFDLLKQNKSMATNITDYYVEYTSSSVLKQYVMLTFTYNLRNFGS